jgi:hypothetical protein
MGGINQVYEICYSSPETDGWTEGTKEWPEGTEIFFDLVLGNEENFSYWHSLRFDGDTTGLTVTVRDVGQSVGAAQVIELESESDEGGASYGMIDQEGRRKILRFSYNSETVTAANQIKNLQVFYQNRRREI